MSLWLFGLYSTEIQFLSPSWRTDSILISSWERNSPHMLIRKLKVLRARIWSTEPGAVYLKSISILSATFCCSLQRESIVMLNTLGELRLARARSARPTGLRWLFHRSDQEVLDELFWALCDRSALWLMMQMVGASSEKLEAARRWQRRRMQGGKDQRAQSN